MDFDSIENLSEEDILNLYRDITAGTDALAEKVSSWTITTCHWTYTWQESWYSGDITTTGPLLDCSGASCSYRRSRDRHTACWVDGRTHSLEYYSDGGTDKRIVHVLR